MKFIKPQLIFPTLLILLDFGAAIVYLCHGDIRRAIYWTAAGVLSICVVY
jgi:hypothetical protein